MPSIIFIPLLTGVATMLAAFIAAAILGVITLMAAAAGLAVIIGFFASIVMAPFVLLKKLFG